MSDQNQLLGHADEADGIDEYDNKLPAWWVGLFVGTIIFAAGYSLDRHFLRPTSEALEYDAEVAAAPKLAVAVAVITPESVHEGKEVFMANCVACHGADLRGGIGVNLTDAEWIHGGKLEDIVKTVTIGVADKGMPTWGPVLGPKKIADVAAFVHEQGGGQ